MVRDDQPQEAPDPALEGVGPPWMRRRRRHIVRRVGGHMETRVSFSVLTLCTMGLAAAAILIVTGVSGGIVYLLDNQKLHALAFFLAGLGLAAISAGFGLGLGFIALPFAGDWFLEWPSHVLGWSIGLSGCALLAALLFLTPLPPYGSLALALAAVSATAYLAAYGLRATAPVGASGGRRGKRR
jgi:hypothetical protein